MTVLKFWRQLEKNQKANTQDADFYNLVWPYGLGNCHLNRATDQYLLNAGKWAKVDLKLPGADDAWQAIPRIAGQLTK